MNYYCPNCLGSLPEPPSPPTCPDCGHTSKMKELSLEDEISFAYTNPYPGMAKMCETIDKMMRAVNQKPYYATAPNKGNRKNQRKKKR